jgi:hypothetical protein
MKPGLLKGRGKTTRQFNHRSSAGEFQRIPSVMLHTSIIDTGCFLLFVVVRDRMCSFNSVFYWRARLQCEVNLHVSYILHLKCRDI